MSPTDVLLKRKLLSQQEAARECGCEQERQREQQREQERQWEPKQEERQIEIQQEKEQFEAVEREHIDAHER